MEKAECVSTYIFHNIECNETELSNVVIINYHRNPPCDWDAAVMFYHLEHVF